MCDCYSQIPKYCNSHKEMTGGYSSVSGLENRVGYIGKNQSSYENIGGSYR
jgi:hypothetical protein